MAQVPRRVPSPKTGLPLSRYAASPQGLAVFFCLFFVGTHDTEERACKRGEKGFNT